MAARENDNSGDEGEGVKKPKPGCFLCEREDAEIPLLPIRSRGQDRWVCVHCLPRLIHG